MILLYRRYKNIQLLKHKLKFSRFNKKVVEKELEEAKEVYKIEKQALNTESNDQNKAEKKVRYAYVVFRSMEAMNVTIKEYNLKLSYRMGIKMCSACCCTKSAKKLEEKEFHEQWIYVKKAT